MEQLIEGPLRDDLAADPPLGYRITFAYGVLVLTRQHFLKEDEEFDQCAERVSGLAAPIREICAASASPQPFETELAPPEWAEKIDETPGETWQGMDSQDLAGFMRSRASADLPPRTGSSTSFHMARAVRTRCSWLSGRMPPTRIRTPA